MVGLRQICLDQKHAASRGFDFHLGLTRGLRRSMVMKNDVKSLPRQSQGEDLSQPVCRASDKGQS